MTKTYALPNPTATVAKILAAGGPNIDPNAVVGNAETHGVKLSWTLTNGYIAITLVSKPFYISAGQVFGELDKFFEDS